MHVHTAHSILNGPYSWQPQIRVDRFRKHYVPCTGAKSTTNRAGRMRLCDRAVELAARCKLAVTPLEKYRATSEFLDFVSSTKKMDLFLSISDTAIAVEADLTAGDKQVLRTEGFTFPEDWENVRELMAGD